MPRDTPQPVARVLVAINELHWPGLGKMLTITTEDNMRYHTFQLTIAVYATTHDYHQPTVGRHRQLRVTQVVTFAATDKDTTPSTSVLRRNNACAAFSIASTVKNMTLTLAERAVKPALIFY